MPSIKMAVKDIFKGIFGKKTLELAKGVSQRDEAQQLSIKTTPDIERVDKKELEQVYISDPICFSSITKSVQMIMAASYGLESESEGTKTYFIDFLNNIGDVGEDLTFNELLEAIYKNQMIYGDAYIELVFNKKMDRIVDLTLIDPKRIDYAKNASNKIILNKYGKPVGYTLKFPWDTPAEGRGDKIPVEYKGQISLSQNQIFMLPERICHFKLYTYGDRFYGLGVIEPAYQSILRKMNIEQAQTNSIYTRGTFPIVVSVGDELHDPTPQDIKSALDNVIKFKYNRYFAFPYYQKIIPLEVKQSDIVDSTLRHLERNQIASHGMPEAFATGAGEATNRATLNNQQQLLEFTLNDITKRTCLTFKKYIFKRISFYNKQAEIPSLIWKEIRAERV